METRFENFTLSVLRLSRCIQKIKHTEMMRHGLKGNQVMCLFYLRLYEEGLTSAELTRLCREDKAAVSRTIFSLREQGILEEGSSSKRYNAKIRLSEHGKDIADQVNGRISDAVTNAGKGLQQSDREVFYRSLGLILSNLEAYTEVFTRD